MKSTLIILSLLLFTLHSKAQFLQNFAIEVGSELPTSLGIRAQGDLNNEFFIKAGLGYSPSFYEGIYESMSLGNDSEVNKLLARGLADSFAFEIAAGYKFQATMNPYILVSFGYVSGGGDRTYGDEVDDFWAALGYGGSGMLDFEWFNLSTDITTLGLKAGIKYPAGESLTLALEGGIVKPISQSVSIDDSEYPLSFSEREDLYDELDRAWKSSVTFVVGFWAIIEL